MAKAKQAFMHSVMNYINLSLFAIIGIALVSIFFSFWITEKTDSDARAINLAGSMRMQTFHIGMALATSPRQTTELMRKLSETWNNPLFTHLQQQQNSSELAPLFYQGYEYWFGSTRPALREVLASGRAEPKVFAMLEKQVALTDELVNQLQHEAEQKIRDLRTLQLFSLLITTIVGSLIFYLLKNRVEAPLSQLTHAARQMSAGTIDQHIAIEGEDELGLLAKAFNQLSQSVRETYDELESRVDIRTRELHRQTVILEFLFRIARTVLDNQNQTLDYHSVVDELSDILQNHDLELCLFTPQGERPYLQVDAEGAHIHCEKKTCEDCKGQAPFDTISPIGLGHHYPITHNDKQYGVIQLHTRERGPIESWQDQLLRSTADQFAIALSLNETKEQEHRLAMLNERTVIARELHDSLAQALSYLQIQVTRLQKSHDTGKFELQQDIIDELREGLSSAYRNLRELLTTFRLKMDIQSGLQGTIEQTVEQLRERSAMDIRLHYSLQDLPLNPMEEIHLLQIAREASQNAINHSEGSRLLIQFTTDEHRNILLSVEDNGKGLSDSPEKLNHYGLAIMQERARHLNGEFRIDRSAEGGTRIELRFRPRYLEEAA